MTVKIHTPASDTKLPVSIFLAGSIDDGNAEEWQQELIKDLKMYSIATDIDFEICNPRRDKWDTDISNSKLKEQILWELDNLEQCDIIAMHFAENSYSPISLLELGLHKNSNIIVYCPKSFYRYTNVKVTCDYYGIPFYKNKAKWVSAIAINAAIQN